MPGPTSPDYSPIQPGPRMEKGNVLAEQVAFLRPENKLGALVRSINVLAGKGEGKNTEVQLGRDVSAALSSFREANLAYEDADRASLDTTRQKLVDAAARLVDVKMQPGLVLNSPAESALVDSVMIAAASGLAEDMPSGFATGRWTGREDWGLGKAIHRAELFRQNQPHVFITRTHEGLKVVIARGEASFSDHGELTINEALPASERAKDRVDQTRASRSRATLSEVMLRYSDQVKSTGGPREIDRVTYRDNWTGNQEEFTFQADKPASIQSAQEDINRAVMDAAESTLYKHSVRLQGIYGSDEVNVVVIGGQQRLDANHASQLAGQYKADGGQPYVDPVSGEKTITLFDSSTGNVDIYPAKRDGVRIDGIISEQQTLHETADEKHKRILNETRGVSQIERLLEKDGVVSLENIEDAFDSPGVGIAAVTTLDTEQANARVKEIEDAIREQTHAFSDYDLAEKGFQTAYSIARRTIGSTVTLTENQERAFYHAVELIAKEMDIYPSDSDLIQRAITINASPRYHLEQVLSDASYVLDGSDTISPFIKDLVLNHIRNAQAEHPDNALLRRNLQSLIDQGLLPESMLTAEQRAVMESGDILSSNAESVAASLVDMKLRPGQSIPDLRVEMLARANTLLGNEGLAELAVEWAMRENRLDAASLRELNRARIDRLRTNGIAGLSDEEFADLEAATLQFDATEKGAFAEATNALLAVEPAVAELLDAGAYEARLRERLIALGVTNTEQQRLFIDVAREANRMSDKAIDARKARTILETMSLDASRANELPTNLYFQYLTLTRATPETVLGAVAEFTGRAGESLSPDTMRSLQELTRVYDGLEGLSPLLEGLVYRAMGQEMSREVPDESDEDRRERLLGKAHELRGLTQNSETQEALVRMAGERPIRPEDVVSTIMALPEDKRLLLLGPLMRLPEVRDLLGLARAAAATEYNNRG